MAHKFNPEHRERLDKPERKTILPPREILLRAGLKPGDTMADVGAGTGYFSIPAAEITGPRGRVYAVDTSPEMLKALGDAITASGAGTVTPVLSGEYDFRLEPGIAGFILISMVLHEVVDGTRFLVAAREILKPGGTMLVIEWKKKEMEMGPPAGDRIAPEDLTRLANLAGFTGIEVIDFNEYFYMVKAFRPGDIPGAETREA